MFSKHFFHYPYMDPANCNEVDKEATWKSQRSLSSFLKLLLEFQLVMRIPGLPPPFYSSFSCIWCIWLYRHYFIPSITTTFDIYSIFTLIPESRGNWSVYYFTPELKFIVTTIVIPEYLKTTILYNGEIIILEIYSLWWDLKRHEVPLVHPMNWFWWISQSISGFQFAL